MKKYTTPQMEVLDMEIEGVIMNGSAGNANTMDVNTSVNANSANEGRNRGAAWSEYDGQ
jgi:hypothetical protein